MKIMWEEKDIIGGAVVGMQKITERWKIGYVYIDKVQRSTLNSMADGMVMSFQDKQNLVNYLNKNNYSPVCLFGDMR